VVGIAFHVWDVFVVLVLFTALATLKPQAGLVAPQAAPASQPAAVVSVTGFLLCFTNQSVCLSWCFVVCLTVTSSPVLQGAGGEPMEISEQVGMTPEIIQKVRAIYINVVNG